MQLVEYSTVMRGFWAASYRDAHPRRFYRSQDALKLRKLTHFTYIIVYTPSYIDGDTHTHIYTYTYTYKHLHTYYVPEHTVVF